ncbi:MAG: hypothetical protein EAZ85_16010 [Bacteroidetes bacterium]|nr:MAG: hypothetical protein EAZ85_16010 [Bacteroidota bacterium]
MKKIIYFLFLVILTSGCSRYGFYFTEGSGNTSYTYIKIEKGNNLQAYDFGDVIGYVRKKGKWYKKKDTLLLEVNKGYEYEGMINCQFEKDTSTHGCKIIILKADTFSLFIGDSARIFINDSIKPMDFLGKGTYFANVKSIYNINVSLFWGGSPLPQSTSPKYLQYSVVFPHIPKDKNIIKIYWDNQKERPPFRYFLDDKYLWKGKKIISLQTKKVVFKKGRF